MLNAMGTGELDGLHALVTGGGTGIGAAAAEALAAAGAKLSLLGRRMEPLQAVSYLDWRGIIITFVWKQTPFVALLLAGALASIDRATLEAGRNLGASRLRVLIELALPQVLPTLLVALVLKWVSGLDYARIAPRVLRGEPA